MIDDTPWDRRVRFARDRSGRAFAYRPDQLITTREGLQALGVIREGAWTRTPVDPPTSPAGEPRDPADRFEDDPLQGPLAEDRDRIGGHLFLARRVPDPVGTARMLRARGIPAQVNHVAFAAAVAAGSGATGYSSSNGLGSPAAQGASNGLGSPAAQWASNGLGSPAAWWASNGLGSPAAWWASNGLGSPWVGGAGAGCPGPFALSCVPVPVPCSCCGDDNCSAVAPLQQAPRQSSVRAAAGPAPDEPPGRNGPNTARKRVLVLDTGLVGAAAFTPVTQPILDPVVVHGEDVSDSDGDDDGLIDYAAGHGTFIAGIYRRLAPMADVTVTRVMHSAGDVDDATVAHALAKAFALDGPTPADVPFHLISLSFTGYTDEDDPPIALAEVLDEIRHRYPQSVAIVASAGNDASCRLTWPAGMEGVVGVGGLGPDGRPAPFTNYGAYVRACAPAVGIVSTFYSYNAGEMPDAPESLKDFTGWARWDGTSFAAPIVGAELLWESAASQRTMSNAVRRRIDDPELFRLPFLGAVVNLR